ncbi:hypothetical protein T261_04202 [Streptomyces lydicus]|nr:hypothetical protein T261_04202 [Streptomyces lydicus]
MFQVIEGGTLRTGRTRVKHTAALSHRASVKTRLPGRKAPPRDAVQRRLAA